MKQRRWVQKPALPGARQSKTVRCAGITDVAAAAAGRMPRPGTSPGCSLDDCLPGRTNMMNSSARKVLLGAALAASMGIGYAIGAQPHMEAGVGLLQNARAEITAATPNKGGHRERALG